MALWQLGSQDDYLTGPSMQCCVPLLVKHAQCRNFVIKYGFVYHHNELNIDKHNQINCIDFGAIITWSEIGRFCTNHRYNYIKSSV